MPPTTAQAIKAKPARASARGLARRVLRIGWALTCIAVIGAVIALGVATKRYGLIPVAVKSGSMEPTMPVHSLIFVKEVPASSVRKGDIITFDPPGSMPRTTHRVISRALRGSKWYFRTKGDANPAPDDWRRGQNNPERYERGITFGSQPAIRHVATIPYLGRVSELGSIPNLRLALFALPFGLIAIQLLIAIWRPRPARTPQPTPDASPDRQEANQQRPAA